MKEQLLQDLKEAMKEKDILKKDTITMLRAAILQVEKDSQKVLTEDEMSAIVAKEVKKRKDAAIDFEKSGRDDLIDQNNAEIEVLINYLPKQLSKEEIEDIVKKLIEETGASSMNDK